MVELKVVEVPEKVFDKILNLYPTRVKVMDDIWNCFNGTPEDKKLIYTNSREWIVCQEYILNYVSQLLYNKECIVGCSDWKQVRVRKVIDLDYIQPTYNGSYCYDKIMKIITKSYTEEEVKEIFNTHSINKDKYLKQYHYYYCADLGKIYTFENCVKYDINGAHAKAVIDLFPKAEKELLELYNKKNEYKAKGDFSNANKIKALFNYFVGMLCRKGYRGTYNYIVNSITRKLFDTLEEVNGLLLYANTDSLVISNPTKKLPHSIELGEFKLEAEGNMYIYTDNNYWVMEYTNSNNEKEHKGSCKLAIRDKIDLANNKVVHYTVKRTLIGVDKQNNPHFKEDIINIKEEILNERKNTSK